MRFVAWVVILGVSGVSVADQPTWNSVRAKFPALQVPLNTKSLTPSGTPLSNKELGVLGFTKSTTPELQELRTATAKHDADEKHVVTPVGAVPRPSGVVLVLRHEHTFAAGSSTESVLLSFDAKGQLLDGFRLADQTSTEAGENAGVGTLTAAGTLGRRMVSTIPMHEEGLPETVTVISEQSARITNAGQFEASAMTFATRDGAFEDKKTHEELRIVGADAYYRGKPEKPFQHLEREGDVVRFKPGGKAYQLSWDERRAVLTCLNPDGSLQQFQRVW